MTAKPVVPCAQARVYVNLAVDHYSSEAGVEIAMSFIDALEHAYAFIGASPAAGSRRWSHEVNLPGLRTTRIEGFPWLVFDLEFETHVGIWRVLHAWRDIPAWMANADGD